MAITPNSVKRTNFKANGFTQAKFSRGTVNGKSAEAPPPASTPPPNCECPPGLGPPDPIATTRLNLEASRRTPEKTKSSGTASVKVANIDKTGVYVTVGGGGTIPLQGLSNGSLTVGQVLVAQVSSGFGASATWMPR
jgi:hypothetical protein